jgi:hypothetical protein
MVSLRNGSREDFEDLQTPMVAAVSVRQNRRLEAGEFIVAGELASNRCWRAMSSEGVQSLHR